jgi:hypothetical protein
LSGWQRRPGVREGGCRGVLRCRSLLLRDLSGPVSLQRLTPPRPNRTSVSQRERRASRKRSSTLSPARVRCPLSRRRGCCQALCSARLGPGLADRPALPCPLVSPQNGTTLRRPRCSRSATSARPLSTALLVSVRRRPPRAAAASPTTKARSDRVPLLPLPSRRERQRLPEGPDP